MLLESNLQYCALVITKILEDLCLNLIMDQKLDITCNCAFRVTLSKIDM